MVDFMLMNSLQMCTDIIFLSQNERMKYQKDYMESIKKLEEQLVMNQRKNEDPHMKSSGEVVVFIILCCLDLITTGEIAKHSRVEDQVLWKTSRRANMTWGKSHLE